MTLQPFPLPLSSTPFSPLTLLVLYRIKTKVNVSSGYIHHNPHGNEVIGRKAQNPFSPSSDCLNLWQSFKIDWDTTCPPSRPPGFVPISTERLLQQHFDLYSRFRVRFLILLFSLHPQESKGILLFFPLIPFFLSTLHLHQFYFWVTFHSSTLTSDFKCFVRVHLFFYPRVHLYTLPSAPLYFVIPHIWHLWCPPLLAPLSPPPVTPGCDFLFPRA